jgi:transcriptional regulator with XRE-family HTH domain
MNSTRERLRVDGDKLRDLRERRAFSVRELAKVSGVSTEVIGALENGRRDTAWPRSIRRLANALGVSPEELMLRAKPFGERS